MKLKNLFSLVVLASLPLAASAQIRITEWMYNGVGGTNEYVELSNLGSSAVNLTGWSFDDSSRTAGSFSLSGLGTLSGGASAIITEDNVGLFRADWSLSLSVPVIGLNDQNLGRADEINIYDASSNLVDRLTYDDQGTGSVKGPRTQLLSANPNTLSVVGANTANAWTLSSVGDSRGTFLSALGETGNPGVFSLNPVPEPGTCALAGMGVTALLMGLRRRK